MWQALLLLCACYRIASLPLPTFAQETQVPETQEAPAIETPESPTIDIQESPTVEENQEIPTSIDVITAPAPDLIIRNITEDGNNAQVVIRNSGSYSSEGCRLFVYRQNGNNWIISGLTFVPSIQPGDSRTVNISGVGSSPTLYFVDATNAVSELNENNNFGFVP